VLSACVFRISSQSFRHCSTVYLAGARTPAAKFRVLGAQLVLDLGLGPAAHDDPVHYADVRYVASGGLNALNRAWLRISMNPARRDGGTCYGDSGGPNFLGAGAGETNIVADTAMTGDSMCRATNVDYRMDTASARAFLGHYVTLP